MLFCLQDLVKCDGNKCEALHRSERSKPFAHNDKLQYVSYGRSPQEFGHKLGTLPLESRTSKSNISEAELLPDSTRSDQIYEE